MKIGVAIAGIGNNSAATLLAGLRDRVLREIQARTLRGNGGRGNVARDVIDDAGKQPPQPAR